ncbi:hypothetical protein [Actinomadura sp. CNU-125]|uniref:hypothetical protein n=1 Tax=Actinomadura sp. CNU-125 TaxID=1904961 RepID=UPI00117734B2|nr:hypothetical protein [Actinomadura sp. CNU-125]
MASTAVRRRCAQLLAVCAITSTAVTATASTANAVINPVDLQAIESISRVDPVLMTNCMTGSAADPVGAVVVPPEVPLVGCLTL